MKIGKHNYIRQLRLHDEKALMYVIDEYGGLLMSVIREHLFGISGRQEECFDDVLLKIWFNISDFDESKSSFKDWAVTIAKYCSIDYLRKYSQEMEVIYIVDGAIVKEDSVTTEMIEKSISEEMDFSEYEEEKLSSDEKEKHRQRILQKVKKTGNENRNKRVWKVAAGIIAAVAITVGVAGVANFILTKQRPNKVFKGLIEYAQNDLDYPDYFADMYRKIGENAVPIEEEVEKWQDEYVIT